MEKIVEFVDPERRQESGSDKRNRKLFMSSKASDVIKESSSSLKRPAREQDEELFIRDFDFSSIFRGVERLVGNSHLSWKEKKRSEQEKVEALGAKPAKKIKVPIDLAQQRLKKRKERETKEASTRELQNPKKRNKRKRNNRKKQ